MGRWSVRRRPRHWLDAGEAAGRVAWRFYRATSAGEGRGSAFTVRLPIMIARPDAVRHGCTLRARSDTRSAHLTVDDKKDAAASLAALLQITGHKTFMAHDGHTALEAEQRTAPKSYCWISGCRCRTATEFPAESASNRVATIIVIALTGRGQEDDRRRSHDGVRRPPGEARGI